MSTQNDQDRSHELSEQDQELLEKIEQLRADRQGEQREENSLYGFCARLASTVPQADDMFQQRLEARLVASLEQQPQQAQVIENKSSWAARLVPARNNQWRVWSHPALRIIASCVALPLLMMILLAAVPPVRASVEQMLQRFGLVLTAPPASTPEPAKGVSASVEQHRPQKLSRAEAQQQVPFPIRLPTWLPDGLTLQGIDVAESGYGCSMPRDKDCSAIKPPVSVRAVYRSQADADANLTVEITEVTSNGGGGYEAPAASAPTVVVNGQPAVYVQGAWQQKQAGDAQNLRWNDAADQSMLSWEEGGLTYVVSAYQLALSLEEMIRIAESLR